MSLKRFAITLGLLGLVLIACNLLRVFAAIPLVYKDAPSIGIIGGADGPTAQSFTSLIMGSWVGAFLLLGVACILTSSVSLFLGKTVKRCCSIKTTATALGLSAAGAGGLICFFSWCVIVDFHEIHKRPVAYPVSVVGGMLSFLVFLVLLVLYGSFRRQKRSVCGVVLDILTIIVYLPFFSLCIALIAEWLSSLI